MTRAEIQAALRPLVGTPFHHQGRQPGVGLDCIGVVVAVGRAVGMPIKDRTDYGGQPVSGLLQRELDAQWVRLPGIKHARPGDILLMRFAREPQHVAVLTDRRTIIHCYEHIGYCCEHRLAGVWQARIVRAYTWPGIEED